MVERVFVAVLAFATLLTWGCGEKVGNPAVENAARDQRFQQLRDNGKRALDAQRFEEAVTDLEEAVRLQDDTQSRELLAQARKS
jgi:hypothetical protein